MKSLLTAAGNLYKLNYMRCTFILDVWENWVEVLPLCLATVLYIIAHINWLC